jgi:hypothetical protein
MRKREKGGEREREQEDPKNCIAVRSGKKATG